MIPSLLDLCCCAIDLDKKMCMSQLPDHLITRCQANWNYSRKNPFTRDHIAMKGMLLHPVYKYITPIKESVDENPENPLRTTGWAWSGWDENGIVMSTTLYHN